MPLNPACTGRLRSSVTWADAYASVMSDWMIPSTTSGCSTLTPDSALWAGPKKIICQWSHPQVRGYILFQGWNKVLPFFSTLKEKTWHLWYNWETYHSGCFKVLHLFFPSAAILTIVLFRFAFSCRIYHFSLHRIWANSIGMCVYKPVWNSVVL